MSDELRRITLELLMTHVGTGPRTTRRLVREGKLPGFMDGARYICSPGEFDDWIAGRWTPKPAAPKPVPFVRSMREAS